MSDPLPDPVRDRTADPPVGPVGVDLDSPIEEAATTYDRPRHARDGDLDPWSAQQSDMDYRDMNDRARERDNGPRYGQQRGPAGAASGLGAMAASAPSAIALLGGVWLVVSRLVFDFPAAGSMADGVLNGLIVGIAITLVALARMTSASSNPVLGLVTAALGGWMIAAPWVFNYAHWGTNSGPTWSDVVTGALIALSGLATWLAGSARQVIAARRAGTAS
jgi:SPW repeat-containing protein